MRASSKKYADTRRKQKPHINNVTSVLETPTAFAQRDNQGLDSDTSGHYSQCITALTQRDLRSLELIAIVKCHLFSVSLF